MSAKWELTQDTLDELLSWLDPNREEAARKYKTLHDGLVKILRYRGCSEAEELADQTINVVARKLRVIRQEYKGNPASYFYGVAKKLSMKHQIKAQKLTPLIDQGHTIANPESTDELAQNCLDSCLQQLSPEKRELVGRYFQEHTPAQRETIAKQLGIRVSTLRVRVFRIVSELKKCVNKCIQRDL
jgi:RNA polymerase sigma factor (sigma-70 family)